MSSSVSILFSYSYYCYLHDLFLSLSRVWHRLRLTSNAFEPRSLRRTRPRWTSLAGTRSSLPGMSFWPSLFLYSLFVLYPFCSSSLFCFCFSLLFLSDFFPCLLFSFCISITIFLSLDSLSALINCLVALVG